MKVSSNVGRVTVNGEPVNYSSSSFFNCTGTATRICPDLLTLDDIGEADNLRGRVVRAFFSLLRAWPI